MITEAMLVQKLAERIHAARGLLPPCPDNNDEDADAWCHEAARIVISDGWVSPEQHRATEQALSAECAGRHAAEKRANEAEAQLNHLDCALRAHAPRDVRHAVLADLADPT